MATSTFRNKNKVRPIKTGAAKREKIKSQRKRVVALGVPADVAAVLQADQLRGLLKYPKQTKEEFAKEAEA